MILFVTFEPHLIVKIWATSGHGERLELHPVQAKDVDDIVSDTAGCSRSAANHGHIGELFLEKVQLFEAGSKVMAPF